MVLSFMSLPTVLGPHGGHTDESESRCRCCVTGEKQEAGRAVKSLLPQYWAGETGRKNEGTSVAGRTHSITAVTANVH